MPSIKETKWSRGMLRVSKNKRWDGPDLDGEFKISRPALSYLTRQLKEENGSELTCDLEGWIRTNENGEYIWIELRPRACEKKRDGNKITLADLFDSESNC